MDRWLWHAGTLMLHGDEICDYNDFHGLNNSAFIDNLIGFSLYFLCIILLMSTTPTKAEENNQLKCLSANQPITLKALMACYWKHWVKDTGQVSHAPPCSPGSQSASSCLWSRTVLPQLTQPQGPGCPCDHGRPAWSIDQLGTHRRCWAEPRTGGPLVLPPHHSLKLGTKTNTGWQTERNATYVINSKNQSVMISD